MQNKDVIIACDFPTKQKTLAFLDQFTGQKPYVKIGMELFYGEGPDVVREIKARGHKIFLDLKLHDIPNTVGSAMKNLAKLGVDMTNLHASGGITMMQAAREGLAAGASGAVPKLIAVTILTSISQQVLEQELLIANSLQAVVAGYAQNAQQAGLDGVVCSPLEAAAVKEARGAGFLTVTPGIRWPEGDVGDQIRVTSPADASKGGSDYIVVGRPITASQNPVQAYQRACLEFLGK
ncbi:MAG: orotidine-5'-phosphate decarboxylase [Oscillospiraceae bacterium]